VTDREQFEQWVAEKFEEPEGDQALVLSQISRLLREVETMNARVREDGPMIEGPRGLPVAHPLLKTMRDHSVVVTRLLQSLGVNETTVTRKARQAANARWNK
jgi:hypothetical protein